MKKPVSFLHLIFCVLIIAGCTALRQPEFRGAAYANPAPPPSFSLPSTEGGTFTLNEQTGNVVLLFFGYTYCPDICPATLGTVKTALNQLTDDGRQDVTVVFISIDPERDTVEGLGRYLDSFNAGYLGVVPALEDLEKLGSDFALVAEKDEVQPDGSYLMIHTGLVYVLDREGNLRLGFFDGTTAEDMAHDLSLLLRE